MSNVKVKQDYQIHPGELPESMPGIPRATELDPGDYVPGMVGRMANGTEQIGEDETYGPWDVAYTMARAEGRKIIDSLTDSEESLLIEVAKNPDGYRDNQEFFLEQMTYPEAHNKNAGMIGRRLLVTILMGSITNNAELQRLDENLPGIGRAYNRIMTLANRRPPWVRHVPEKTKAVVSNPNANKSSDEKMTILKKLQEDAEQKSKPKIDIVAQPARLV